MDGWIPWTEIDQYRWLYPNKLFSYSIENQLVNKTRMLDRVFLTIKGSVTPAPGFRGPRDFRGTADNWAAPIHATLYELREEFELEMLKMNMPTEEDRYR